MEIIGHDGKSIRLTEERQQHILEHVELAGHMDWIKTCLEKPEKVFRSSGDENAHLYYRYYVATQVGDKWLCVVVKFNQADAFVVTAYLTNRVQKGEQLWPKQ